MEVDWQPLESNVDVINSYVSSIGMDTSIYTFQDLLSCEEWAQQMVSRPVLGLLFIYEISTPHKEARKAEEEKILKEGQNVSENLFYMRQFAKNACGTVGVFHILGNLPTDLKYLIEPESTLGRFLAAAKGQDPESTGKQFMHSDGVKKSHVEASKEGSTEVTDHLKTTNHFISFVMKDGDLYELDGSKKFAVNHGPTTDDTFFADACNKVRDFVAIDPCSLNAGLIVLAPRSEFFDDEGQAY